ncbi:hypothetical protein HY994_05815 [Candidatus Micrarchaeota archaeon]|nr:hypothetical protein [Candidatus Micrarchaeota archaeon]
MNLGVFSKSLMLTLSISLVAFGLSGFLAAHGITAFGLLTDVWKLVALSLGISIIVAAAYPHLRGVKQGDQMVAFLRREQVQGGQRQSVMDVVFATALEDGKTGQKIKIALGNGMQAEGLITGYGGTFSPATLKITETERFG